MRRRRVRLTRVKWSGVLVWCAVWVGCGRNPEPACVPGQQVTCACPGGVSGTQVCTSDGSAYAECRCEAPARAEPSRKKFVGSRVGPLLADLSVPSDVLVSHDEMRGEPCPPFNPSSPTLPCIGPVPVPRESNVEIRITLSNDSDHTIDVDDDSAESGWLFRITVENDARQEVFRHEEKRARRDWDKAEVKEFVVRWIVRGPGTHVNAGPYTVSVKFGFGGGLTARTNLR